MMVFPSLPPPTSANCGVSWSSYADVGLRTRTQIFNFEERGGRVAAKTQNPKFGSLANKRNLKRYWRYKGIDRKWDLSSPKSFCPIVLQRGHKAPLLAFSYIIYDGQTKLLNTPIIFPSAWYMPSLSSQEWTNL